MSNNHSVTWRWIAVTAVSILVLGGGSWMTTMYAQVKGIEREQKEDRREINDIRRKVDVIEERTRNTEDNVKEIREGQKEQSRKLDELLRRP